jgi:hypothetical protein
MMSQYVLFGQLRFFHLSQPLLLKNIISLVITWIIGCGLPVGISYWKKNLIFASGSPPCIIINCIDGFSFFSKKQRFQIQYSISGITSTILKKHFVKRAPYLIPENKSVSLPPRHSLFVVYIIARNSRTFLFKNLRAHKKIDQLNILSFFLGRCLLIVIVSTCISRCPFYCPSSFSWRVLTPLRIR